MAPSVVSSDDEDELKPGSLDKGYHRFPGALTEPGG